MFAFVLNVTLLLFVYTLHNTLIALPARLPKGNLTKILDILNEKFGTAKKNTTAAVVDDAQSGLTEKEQKLMDVLLNRLYKRVIDDGLDSDKAIDSSVRGGVSGAGEISRVKHVTRVDGGDNNVDDVNFDQKKKAFTRRVPTVVSLGTRSGVVDGRPSVAEGARAPRPSDPMLQRFTRLADMLDRPDGVDEAVRTVLTIPSLLLNGSAVLDERCPFDRLVDDDEQLVASIIKRLRCLHGSKSGYYRSVRTAD